tara:strand:+ start:1515 stop:2360 length:846 start_codon:yes stop_codon:yes gene_type:complete
MNEQDIAKLKAAGFTDTDIADYSANEMSATTSAAPAETLPEVDVTKQSQMSRNAEAAGIPTTNEGNYLADAAAIGAAAAPYVIPVGAAGLGLYGAAKVGGWGRDVLNTGREMAGAYKTGVAQNSATQEFRALERMARGAGPEADMARQRLQELIRSQARVGPVAPQGGQQAFQQMGQQLARGPVAPQGMPAQSAQPQGIMQRGMDIASKMRQFAAQRVMPAAGAAAVPAGVALGGAAATGMAGNQMANMTPEQRKAYYDSTMMGAMSGDAGLAAAIMNRGQ